MHDTLSLAEREAFIRTHTLFRSWSAQTTHELALLLKELSVPAGTILVQEEDLVDSLYFIIQGQAEVSHILSKAAETKIHIANLGPNDVIGLTDSGFFSNTGLRTATVVAKEAMVLLVLKLKEFDKLLKETDINYPVLKNASERFTCMIFLKENYVFQNLSHEQLRQLSHEATRLSVNQDHFLFREGDCAQTCYFLLKGKIQLLKKEQGEQQLITTLEFPAILGESVFIIENDKRNASALAQTDCELLVITKQAYQNTTSSHSKTHSILSRIFQWFKA